MKKKMSDRDSFNGFSYVHEVMTAFAGTVAVRH